MSILCSDYVPSDYVPYFVCAIILGLVAFHHSWYFLSFFWLTITLIVLLGFMTSFISNHLFYLLIFPFRYLRISHIQADLLYCKSSVCNRIKPLSNIFCPLCLSNLSLEINGHLILRARAQHISWSHVHLNLRYLRHSAFSRHTTF
jgi:hypothetical protein